MANYNNLFANHFDDIWQDVKSKFRKLGEKDRKAINGSYDEFLKRLQKLYKYNETEVQEVAELFIDNLSLAGDTLLEKSEKIYENMQEMVGRAEDAVANMVQTIKTKSSDTHESVTTYVKENPLKTILFAAAAGIVASKII